MVLKVDATAKTFYSNDSEKLLNYGKNIKQGVVVVVVAVVDNTTTFFRDRDVMWVVKKLSSTP